MARIMITYDPGQLRRMNEHDLSVRSDFRRARRFLEGTWPQPLPEMILWNEASIERIEDDYRPVLG